MTRAGTTGRQRLAVLGAVALPLALVGVLAAWPAAGPPPVGVAPAAAAVDVLRVEPAVGQPDGEVVRLRSGGRERAVLVQEPRSGAARALALVLGPHGLTAARTSHDLRMDALRERGYAVAYPSALDGDWNAGRCCGSSHADGVDDVAFLHDVRTVLGQRYPGIEDRVALVGYSTGGQMVYRTVCTSPDFARAAVVVAGSLETDCTPSAPLPPTLVVHGVDDSTVPWAFTTRRLGLLDYAPQPALASIAAYARAADCGRRRLDRTDGRWLMGWDGCTLIDRLEAVGMPGTGHGWEPLGGSIYTERFFGRHLA